MGLKRECADVRSVFSPQRHKGREVGENRDAGEGVEISAVLPMNTDCLVGDRGGSPDGDGLGIRWRAPW